jgi:hypothetical protein
MLTISRGVDLRSARQINQSHRARSLSAKRDESVAFEDSGARVDPAGVRNDQRSVLCLQERSPDLTRPDDEVPQAVKLLDEDVHVSAFLPCLRGVVDELTRRFNGHIKRMFRDPVREQPIEPTP